MIMSFCKHVYQHANAIMKRYCAFKNCLTNLFSTKSKHAGWDDPIILLENIESYFLIKEVLMFLVSYCTLITHI